MLTLSRSVVSTETDYGTALLDQRSGRYWTLNPTATLILRVLLDGGDRSRAVDALLDQFDVEPDTARADVDRLIDQLHAAGLVTGAAPRAEPGAEPISGHSAATPPTPPVPRRRPGAPLGTRLPFRRPPDPARGRHSRRNSGTRAGRADGAPPADRPDDRGEAGR